MSLKITILEFSPDSKNSSQAKMKVKSKDVYSQTPITNGPFFTFHQQFDYMVRSSNHKFKSDVSHLSFTPPKLMCKRNRPLSSSKPIEKPKKMKQAHASIPSPQLIIPPNFTCNSPPSPSVESNSSNNSLVSNTTLNISKSQRIVRTSISIRELLN